MAAILNFACKIFPQGCRLGNQAEITLWSHTNPEQQQQKKRIEGKALCKVG